MARPECYLVLGAGGHGRVVAELARTLGAQVAGFADADPALLGARVASAGGSVIVDARELLDNLRTGKGLPGGAHAVLMGVGRNADRLAACDAMLEYVAPMLGHPTAVISPSAGLGAGTVVLAHAVVNTGARIGRAVIINTAAVIEHDCELADGVHISPGAVLAGGVRVGTRSWIGAGAVVIQGICIGDEVTVGAGAVVVRDVPNGVTVVGNPARILRPEA